MSWFCCSGVASCFTQATGVHAAVAAAERVTRIARMFMKGLGFGFILAATVGPMWVLCFRRTMASGALAGLASGMGIAVADGFYGAVAAFGLTAISGFLLAHSFWLGLVG